MRRLRAPDGCPWDREQTHESLRPYLLEEAAEAADALRSSNPVEMADELGDVLLQIAFHAVIAEAAGTFSYEDIEGAIVNKLERRHPHVFGDGESRERRAGGGELASHQGDRAGRKSARRAGAAEPARPDARVGIGAQARVAGRVS